MCRRLGDTRSAKKLPSRGFHLRGRLHGRFSPRGLGSMLASLCGYWQQCSPRGAVAALHDTWEPTMNDGTSSSVTSGPEIYAHNGLGSNSPTHVRWFILFLVVVIMAINTLDRLSLGVIGRDIQDEYHLTTQAMGWVLGSFFLGYAFFQIPLAYVGERFGARTVLTF